MRRTWGPDRPLQSKRAQFDVETLVPWPLYSARSPPPLQKTPRLHRFLCCRPHGLPRALKPPLIHGARLLGNESARECDVSEQVQK
jgi:hypothetical protein